MPSETRSEAEKLAKTEDLDKIINSQTHKAGGERLLLLTVNIKLLQPSFNIERGFAACVTMPENKAKESICEERSRTRDDLLYRYQF